MTDYPLIKRQIESIIEDVPYLGACLSNVSSILYHSMDDVSWVGFYLIKDNQLVLDTFQGQPACSLIPLNKGVCGKAASIKETVLVDDVHQFEGHIACDSASKSEIVVPLIKDDKVLGVLDIDSYSYNRFNNDDKNNLEEIVTIILDKLQNLF